jgi:hypothetical protein
MGMSNMESRFEHTRMMAVASKATADRSWPGEESIGKRSITILGVVGDTKHWSISDQSPPAMYFPVWEWPDNGLYLTV